MTDIFVEPLSSAMKARGQNKKKISLERSDLNEWVKQAESLEDDVARLTSELERQKEIAQEADFQKEKMEKLLQEKTAQLGEAVQEVQRLQDEVEKTVTVLKDAPTMLKNSRELCEFYQAEASKLQEEVTRLQSVLDEAQETIRTEVRGEATEEEAAKREELWVRLRSIQNTCDSLVSNYEHPRCSSISKDEILQYLRDISQKTVLALAYFETPTR